MTSGVGTALALENDVKINSKKKLKKLFVRQYNLSNTAASEVVNKLSRRVSKNRKLGNRCAPAIRLAALGPMVSCAIRGGSILLGTYLAVLVDEIVG